MKELVEEEEALLAFKGGLPEDNALIAAKKDGFSDKYLSQILEVDEDEIRNKRISLGVEETWEGVHVSGTRTEHITIRHITERTKTRSVNEKSEDHDLRRGTEPYRTGNRV